MCFRVFCCDGNVILCLRCTEHLHLTTKLGFDRHGHKIIS